MRKHPDQNGAAIIIALFVTAIVAATAVAMMERLQLDTRRTELILHATLGYFYADGSLAWAYDQLNTNWMQKKNDKVIDKTPIVSPENIIDNTIRISSTIYDPTGRFNINNLTKTDDQEIFARLIHLISPETPPSQAQAITLALMDWISENQDNGFETFYLKQVPPYSAPHRPAASVSEVRLVKGVNAELFSVLSHYITALPESTSININNASAPILMALSPKLSLEAANAIIKHRKETPFVSVEKFLQWDVVKNNPFPNDKVTVLSKYFLVKTHVKVNDQETILFTLVKRLNTNGKSTIQTIWQSKGTL